MFGEPTSFPSGLILLFVLPMLALLGLLGYWFILRPRLKRKQSTDGQPTQTATPTTHASSPQEDIPLPDVATLSEDDLAPLLSHEQEPLLPMTGTLNPQNAPAPLLPFDDVVPYVATTLSMMTTPTPANRVAQGRVIVPLHSGEDAEAEALITILRDSADGRLMVQMNGQGYRSLLDVPEVKKQFTLVMKELSKIVTEPAPPRPVVTPPTPTPIVAPMMPAPAPIIDTLDNALQPIAEMPMQESPLEETPITDHALQPLEEAPIEAPLDDFADLPSLEDLVEAPMDASLPPLVAPRVQPKPKELDPTAPQITSFDLPKYSQMSDDLKPKRRGWTGVDVPKIPTLNIPQAIEMFLQQKLLVTGDFANRVIHVLEASDGGVLIQVDGQYFEGVNDVSDPQVREYLRDTIQEWQNRQ